MLTFSIEKYLVIMVSRGKDSAHSHPFSIARVPEVLCITEHFPFCGFLYSIYFNRSKTKRRFALYCLYRVIRWLTSPSSLVRFCSTPFVLGEAAKCWGLMEWVSSVFQGCLWCQHTPGRPSGLWGSRAHSCSSPSTFLAIQEHRVSFAETSGLVTCFFNGDS